MGVCLLGGSGWVYGSVFAWWEWVGVWECVYLVGVGGGFLFNFNNCCICFMLFSVKHFAMHF